MAFYVRDCDRADSTNAETLYQSIYNIDLYISEISTKNWLSDENVSFLAHLVL